MVGLHYIGVPEGAMPGEAVKDVEKGLTYMRMSCDGGFVAACHDIGMSLQYWIEGPRDYTKGRLILEGTCEDGFAESCDGLVQIYSRGDGVEKDETKVAQYQQKEIAIYETQCEKKEVSGCFELALRYRTGFDGIEKDLVKAGEYLAIPKENCEKGEGTHSMCDELPAFEEEVQLFLEEMQTE